MLKRMGLKRGVVNLLLLAAILSSFNVWASSTGFGEILCKQSGYHCVKVKRGDSWAQMFPDEHQRDLVKRVNRLNVFLKPGMVIAVPEDLPHKTLLDVAPFPRLLQTRGEKWLDIDLQLSAFAAYNESGILTQWGPISTGMLVCPETDGGCLTPKGVFRVVRKRGGDCISTVFPKRLLGQSGGAPMPYCIHFYKGYAIHGSDELPGRASTHGCVNVFNEDAKWLNEHFVEVPHQGHKGTLIVIR
jgi:hypothetical protein